MGNMVGNMIQLVRRKGGEEAAPVPPASERCWVSGV
jgi:hypothetical protein